jgi:hypothetical protein
MKKTVRWVTPSNVRERIVDSGSVESENDMTVEEEGYKETGTEPSLLKCAPSQSCYTECSSGRVTHSPSSPSASEDDNDEQSMPHQWTPQQPATSWWALLCCPPNTVVHIYNEDPRRKISEKTHTKTASLCLAISCCILQILSHCC